MVSLTDSPTSPSLCKRNYQRTIPLGDASDDMAGGGGILAGAVEIVLPSMDEREGVYEVRVQDMLSFVAQSMAYVRHGAWDRGKGKRDGTA